MLHGTFQVLDLGTRRPVANCAANSTRVVSPVWAHQFIIWQRRAATCASQRVDVCRVPIRIAKLPADNNNRGGTK
jgi:hypothetical protein